MNILSNFLAQGAQNPTKNQDANNFAAKDGKQGMGQKFTQLMMGFLGMNPMDGSVESTDMQMPAGENAKQLPGKSNESTENEALAGLFLGSHFVTMPVAQDQADIAVDSSGNQSSGEQPVHETADSVLKDLSTEGKNTKAPSEKGEGKAVAKNQSTAKVYSTENGQSLGNAKKAQNMAAGPETEHSNSPAEVQGAVKGEKKSISADQQNTASSTKEAVGKTPLSAKNGTPPTATPGSGPDKELNPKTIKAPAGDVQASQKQDTNTQQASSARSTDTQKAGDQKAAYKNKPAVKKLLHQAAEKINLSEPKKAQTKAAQKLNADTKAHSSLKSELTQTAAGATASGQDKPSFKPLKQHSSTFELDPSKIASVESGGSGDIKMDLQARSDSDTSAKDDGKMSFKVGSSALSHLSNTNGRREFSTQLVRQLQQAESGKGEAAKNWNHHRFVMDDGKTLNVSVRHTQGAMHLQLGAGDTQLNKIIQQHIDEIRQHLQEQMNVEINLELQHFGGQQAGQENGNSQSKTHNAQNPLAVATGPAAENGHQAPARTTRYLGFNTNEWTA